MFKVFTPTPNSFTMPLKFLQLQHRADNLYEYTFGYDTGTEQIAVGKCLKPDSLCDCEK